MIASTSALIRARALSSRGARRGTRTLGRSPRRRTRPRREHERGSLAEVVRVGLEGKPKERHGLPAELAEVFLELADDSPLLQLVDLDHRVQELEVVAGVRRELLQRNAVFRETASAPADPCPEEVRAEPVVEA